MSDPTPLSRLKLGDRAIVTAIDAASGATAKLAARGIVPGICIGILCAGDPVLIGVDNDRWALNRTEASAILVAPIPRERRGLRSLLRRL